MRKEYFVMLTTQDGSCAPMTDEGELALYDSVADAAAAAEENMLGNAFGFEVFRRGNGELVSE